ncbi:MAG: hypothetical protein NXI23_25680 [Bacteroidetes bacterium]|jgi:hypothetical protein|nr:hypothetical protein [Bacteroidota bacterium]MDF1866115.1 hypothetical protein [Saprospiraceae bacterium]
MSNQKFGVHKLWFFYTDEWYVTSEENMAGTVGVYESREAAEKAKKRYDIEALKKLWVHDILRDTTHFYEKFHKETQKKIVEYAQSQGWDNHLREHHYSNGEQTYWELMMPSNITNEQLEKMLDLTGAFFHTIVAYNEVKDAGYIQMNYGFWGAKYFKKLTEDGFLDKRSPFVAGQQFKGKYIIFKPLKGRKSAKFKSYEDAQVRAAEVFVNGYKEFPDNNALGKSYILDWSKTPELLLAFLKNSESFTLSETIVSEKEVKKTAARLKKLKSTIPVEIGMTFYEMAINDEYNPKEILGFLEMIEQKPFTLHHLVSEVNGKTIKEYVPDCSTF